MAKVGLLSVTDLATDMVLSTAYSNGRIEQINLTKGTLKPTGSSPVKNEESVGDAAYSANNK